MFGQNEISSILENDGQHLFVHSLFYTIQGEGPFSGRPAIFLRLQGCNLKCKFCDTEFDSGKSQDIESIFQNILAIAPQSKLVVITGGEPLRQNITPLIELLIDHDYTVQIETNGTIKRDLPKGSFVVCCPKSFVEGKYKIRKDIQIDALKFLISTNIPKYSQLPANIENYKHIPIFIQPMDEYDDIKNRNNMKLAISIAMDYGYPISLQQHKYMDIA